MGNTNCNNCENNNLNSKNNIENLDVLKNDSYISFKQETVEPKLEEKNVNTNLNQIVNISKQSEHDKNEEEKNIFKNNLNKITCEEIKEKNNENINNQKNEIMENGRIQKKEMPSSKNENKTRNIINDLAELNNDDNFNNNDIIKTKSEKNENDKNINNIVDNNSYKIENEEKQNEDYNQDNNIITNDSNNKRNIFEFNIFNIFPKNKLLQLTDNSILCHGFLEKIIKIPSKNKFIYNERFCVLTKKNFSYYKSKENYLNLWKPLFSIDLQYIKKVEQRVSEDKIFYFGLICIINDETRQYINKINTFVNNNENNKEEFLIGFRSKNKQLILKWIIILNYFKDNYEQN